MQTAGAINVPIITQPTTPHSPALQEQRLPHVARFSELLATGKLLAVPAVPDAATRAFDKAMRLLCQTHHLQGWRRSG
jgi:hypothetical protein